MKPPTPSQLNVLRIAARDGSIIESGIDKTPKLNKQAMDNCFAAGWLKWMPGKMNLGGIHTEYVLTDEGKRMLTK